MFHSFITESTPDPLLLLALTELRSLAVLTFVLETLNCKLNMTSYSQETPVAYLDASIWKQKSINLELSF